MSLDNFEDRDSKVEERERKEKETRELEDQFDATPSKNTPSIRKTAGGVSEQTIVEGAADAEKLRKTKETVSGMADVEIDRMGATVGGASEAARAEFKTETERAKGEFLSAAETVMSNPNLDAKAKKERVEMLFRHFVDQVEAAQGKALALPAEAEKEKNKKRQEAEKDGEKANREFREKFEKAFKESQERIEQERVRKEQEKLGEIRRGNEAKVTQERDRVPDPTASIA